MSLDCEHDLHHAHCTGETCGCACHSEERWTYLYGWTAIDVEAVRSR
jgi:hypothetical protein